MILIPDKSIPILRHPKLRSIFVNTQIEFFIVSQSPLSCKGFPRLNDFVLIITGLY